MFYRKNGRKINIVNDKPINLSKGGMIPRLPGIPEKDMDKDTILADLEEGSLVIPVPVMRKGVMKEYEGETTGPVQRKKEKLVRAIVMPHEKVVHRKHAPKVERFLARKGIKLPLGS